MTSMVNEAPTLNPALREFWKTKADVKVLRGGRASSKCLAAGTRVIMADYSLKNVEDVVVGDSVMGPNGSGRNVLCVNTGRERMYRIKQFYGDDYSVNESHVLSLKKRLSGGRYPNEPNILNISVRDFLRKSSKFKSFFRGYKSGLIGFPAADLCVSPYYLGLWLGDGCYRDASVTSADKEIGDFLFSYCGRVGVNCKPRQDKRSRGVTYEITGKPGMKCDNKIWEGLKSLGVAESRVRGVKAKSKKHIPMQYLKSSESQRLDLLAGLLDSDGTYCREKNSYVITQKMDSIASGIKRLSNSLGFRTTTSNNLVKYNGAERLQFVVTITGDLWRIPCKIERKKPVKVKNKCDYLTNALRIEDIGHGDYYGFGLDGDNLFLLEDNTVTHNTWDTAGFAVYLACNYTVKFLCMRQFQNRIQESVYAIIKIQIERFGLEAEFEILKSVIKHRETGSEFHFYGIHRNIAEIKGFEGADIGWIEEAEGLTKEQWSVIEPTLRKEGAEAWLLFNPHLVSDFINTFAHNPDGGVIVRHINYDENPFMSETMLRKISRLKEQDYDEYEHIYLGVAMSDDERVVIKRSWIEASIDAHIKLGIEPAGERRAGFDVADGGKDLCSQIHTHGLLAYWGEHWKAGEDELLASCERVYSKAVELGSSVSYDSIGVGALAGSKFADMNQQRNEAGLSESIKYSKFIAGAKVIDPDAFYVEAATERVTNKDFFANLKAQSWWVVADRFRNTYNAVTKGESFNDDELISISSDMPNLANLVTELSTPRRDFDRTGRVKVESKEDLAKRDVASPNDADAFIMAYSPTSRDIMNELLDMALGG